MGVGIGYLALALPSPNSCRVREDAPAYMIAAQNYPRGIPWTTTNKEHWAQRSLKSNANSAKVRSRMGDKQADMGIGVISTGSLGLDVALGIGGLPRGRIVEIYGRVFREATLTLQVVAEAQKAGGTATFVDAEHALDPIYAEHLGVNVDDLLVSQPDAIELHSKLRTCSCVPGRSTW